jgi:GNAT superfamily N-acetyltransferase
MTPNLLLRPARTDEAELLTAIVRRSKASHGYDEAFMELLIADTVIAPEQIAAEQMMVAEIDGRAVAFAHLMPIYRPETVYLENLFVEPDVQNAGVGRALFEWALTEAERQGYAWLEWDSDPNAAPFYEKMGGEKIAENESTIFPGRMIPKFRKPTRSQPDSR